MKYKILGLMALLFCFHLPLVSAQDNYQEDYQLLLDGNTDIELTAIPAKIVTLRENASLTIRNVHMETIFNRTGNTIKFDVFDNSKLVIINSVIPATVYSYNSSSVEVYNSTVFHASWCSVPHGFHNGSGIFAYGSSGFKVRDSKIGYIRASGDNTGTVVGGSMMEIGSRNAGTDTDIRIEVENSTIGRVHLTDPEKRLSNIRNGFHEELLIDYKRGMKIQLYDSELRDGLSVYVRNRNIEITDCDFYVLDTNNCSKVETKNSSFTHFALFDTERVELDNCNVTSFYIRSETDLELSLNHTNIEIYDVDVLDSYKLFAQDSVIDTFHQGMRVEMELHGVDVEFKDREMEVLSMVGEYNLENNTLPVLVYQIYLNANMTVDREYSIFVKQLNKPVEEALVEVLDGDDVVFSTRTDSDGYADIRLIFYERIRLENHKMLKDSNVTESYLLRVSDNDLEYTQRLDVYSVSPILVEYEYRVDETMLVVIAVLCLASIFYLIKRNQK